MAYAQDIGGYPWLLSGICHEYLPISSGPCQRYRPISVALGALHLHHKISMQNFLIKTNNALLISGPFESNNPHLRPALDFHAFLAQLWCHILVLCMGI